MQRVGLAHDTPERLVSLGAAGLGLGRIDQALPFHRTTNVLCGDPLALH
jgi:hypothetical protein